MPRKNIVLTLIVMFLLLSSVTCWAEEKLINNISSVQEAVDKLFAGRVLDPVEGIWVKDEDCEIAIVKASLVNPKNPKFQGCDYFGVYTKGKFAGVMFAGLKKTKYSFVFNGVGGYNTTDGSWKLLTPTVLQFDGKPWSESIDYTTSLVRIYPSP